MDVVTGTDTSTLPAGAEGAELPMIEEALEFGLEALSADLRTRDFRFVGPTVCYSHLQAAGLINDHLVSCFRYAELTGSAG